MQRCSLWLTRGNCGDACSAICTTFVPTNCMPKFTQYKPTSGRTDRIEAIASWNLTRTMLKLCSTWSWIPRLCGWLSVNSALMIAPVSVLNSAAFRLALSNIFCQPTWNTFRSWSGEALINWWKVTGIHNHKPHRVLPDILSHDLDTTLTAEHH